MSFAGIGRLRRARPRPACPPRRSAAPQCRPRGRGRGGRRSSSSSSSSARSASAACRRACQNQELALATPRAPATGRSSRSCRPRRKPPCPQAQPRHRLPKQEQRWRRRRNRLPRTSPPRPEPRCLPRTLPLRTVTPSAGTRLSALNPSAPRKTLCEALATVALGHSHTDDRTPMNGDGAGVFPQSRHVYDLPLRPAWGRTLV